LDHHILSLNLVRHRYYSVAEIVGVVVLEVEHYGVASSTGDLLELAVRPLEVTIR
jgi:hypothetical protein